MGIVDFMQELYEKMQMMHAMCSLMQEKIEKGCFIGMNRLTLSVPEPRISGLL